MTPFFKNFFASVFRKIVFTIVIGLNGMLHSNGQGPVAAFDVNPNPACQGEVVTFTNLSTGNVISYSWNYGDGTGWFTTTNPANQTHTYAVAGNFTVYLVVADAFVTDTASVLVTVKPGPQAILTNDNPVSCDSAYVSFTDYSINAISWKWDFKNGNFSLLKTPPKQFYGVPGIYPAQLTVTSANGCTHSSVSTIQVFQSPLINFLPLDGCVNVPVQFTDQSTSSPNDPIINWIWNFGDGTPTSTVKNPQHTYTSTGTYQVILNASTSSCSKTDTLPIAIHSLPSAQFSADTSTGCTPLSVNFIDGSTGATSYSWNFGDGSPTSSLMNPNHVFVNNSSKDTAYTVQLLVKNIHGCTDTSRRTITVFAGTHATFSSSPSAGCNPLPVHFTNTSTNVVSSIWNFGDGSSPMNDVNPSHTFLNKTSLLQTYFVTLTVNSAKGCRDTAIQAITVYPEANFSITASPVDTGCNPLPVAFATSPGGTSFQWDFNDGGVSSLQNPSHVFKNTGVLDSSYHVRLIASNAYSCLDTVFTDILVIPQPVASFTASITKGCQPLTVYFQNTSIASIYYWDFGDGSSSTLPSPDHIFYNTTNSSASYPVKLIVTSEKGCQDTLIIPVEVYPQVNADFDPDSSGCTPLTINFRDKSIGSNQYLWNFGDGKTDSLPSPQHTFTNTTQTPVIYTVSLSVKSPDGCTDSISKKISVHPRPQASFTASPLSQTFPNATVNLVNTSSSGNWSYIWNFGDGDTSHSENPLSHTYKTWGSYTIQLTVKNQYCADSSVQTIIIIPPIPIASFNISDSIGCRPFAVNFTNQSLYGTNYTWDFGDGGTSTQMNPGYIYNNTGIYNVSLVVTGVGGQKLTSKTIIVHETPKASFTLNPTLIFVPNTAVNFNNTSTNSTSFLWDFGDNSTSTMKNPQHFYTTAGVYDVILVTRNQFGCTDTLIMRSAVTAENKGNISFPNAFTPDPSGSNGGTYNPQDLSNNVFFPFAEGVESYNLKIYNRWGELLFESKDLKTGWDGYYRGKLCQQDVYVWKVNVLFSDGRQLVTAGDVTLLR